MPSFKLSKCIIFPSILFLVNILIQNYNLGRLVNVFTDEGVYLYSAKLIEEGKIPYQDFFLAQTPFLLYPISLFFNWVGLNLNLFHFLYTIWVFSTIFPLYAIVFKLTKNHTAAIFSIILFSTFPELVQWDAHMFAYRQASLPILAFSIYFIINSRLLIGGFLLGLFALTSLQNLLLALGLLLSVLIAPLFDKEKPFANTLRNTLNLLYPFSLIIILGYLCIFLTPNGINNVINYQRERPFFPYQTRLEWLKLYSLPANWPILIFGFLGSIIALARKKWLALFNFVSFPAAVFAGVSYFPHYITILAVGFILSSGIFINFFSKYRQPLTFIIPIIILWSIYTTAFNTLKSNLIDHRTPDFFTVVDYLKKTPEPLFTFEPIYALYANKNLTYHYNTADMRQFRVKGTNLIDAEYLDILKRSNTILLQNTWISFISLSSIEYINRQFELKYSDPENQLFIRKIYE